MFSTSMAPRDTAGSEMGSDVTTPVPFADYEDKESSLVQAAPHPAEMPNYPESIFSIQLPSQPSGGDKHMDTPHGEYSGSEGSSSGDVDAPEAVLSTAPVFVTAIVYKEDQSTANTTQAGLIVPTVTTPGVSEGVVNAENIQPMTGVSVPLSTEDQIPVNVLFVGIPEKNDSSEFIDISSEGKFNLESHFSFINIC